MKRIYKKTVTTITHKYTETHVHMTGLNYKIKKMKKLYSIICIMVSEKH